MERRLSTHQRNQQPSIAAASLHTPPNPPSAHQRRTGGKHMFGSRRLVVIAATTTRTNTATSTLRTYVRLWAACGYRSNHHKNQHSDLFQGSADQWCNFFVW